MSPYEIEKRAFALECFLNASGLKDGADRAKIESTLMSGLMAYEKSKVDIIYHNGAYALKTNSKEMIRLVVPASIIGLSSLSTWTNGSAISAIDPKAYGDSGALNTLGSEGLNLGLDPKGAKHKDNKSSESSSSDWSVGDGSVSSNNNNNNNNNG